MKIVLLKGVSYFNKETIKHYGKDLLRKITGIKNIKEIENESNRSHKDYKGKRKKQK